MKILLVPIGSHGDVHPFVGIGIGLRNRGHRVTVLTNAHFEPLVHAAGLEFDPLATDDEYRAVMAEPDLWDEKRGWKVVQEKGVLPLMRRTYDAVLRHYHAAPDETVVVMSTLAFGARVAQDKFRIPAATLHLQPSIFLSAYELPRMPTANPPRSTPVWMKRLFLNLVAKWMVDPVIARPLNAFRKEVGLPPVSKVMLSYWHSPDRVIGMFPDWFAPPQPDWPAQTRLTGFPLYDERGIEPLAGPLVEFLNAGAAPVAFTPGSAMLHGNDFFSEAARACEVGGFRGILLTRHADQIPSQLPAGVIHVPYAPFSQLLPRCAALVHHGGIGTTSQAMAAGIPQLIMPMTHDQPDNAARVKKLGVGAEISVRQFKSERVAAVLSELIASESVHRKCKEVAGRIAQANAIEETCELIERLREA